jgi:hypothetical protein
MAQSDTSLWSRPHPSGSAVHGAQHVRKDDGFTSLLTVQHFDKAQFAVQ